MSRAAFFRARAGKPDANAKDIIDGLRADGHFVVVVRSADDGVPDLLVYRGLCAPYADTGRPQVVGMVPHWLELKTRAGRLLKSQKDWRAQATALGIPVTMVRSLLEARVVLKEGR